MKDYRLRKGKKKSGTSKYHSRKVIRDGIMFDSVKEANRWNELCLLEMAGAISELRRQVKYILIPAQKEPDTKGPRGGVIKGKLIEREVCYISDFTYIDKFGNVVVEDAKGYKGGQAYALFTIKRKLMLLNYGIKIKEV